MALKIGKPVDDDPHIDTARLIILRHSGDLHAAVDALGRILADPSVTAGAFRAAIKVRRIIRDKIALN